MTDQESPDIHFMHITAATLNQVCDLSETLSPAQRHMLADNVRSIAEAHFSESLAIRERLAPESLELAASLERLLLNLVEKLEA